MTRAIRRATLFLVLAALLSAAPSLAAADKVPDWVKQAAAEAQSSYDYNPYAVTLLDDAEYTILPNGHALLHQRTVHKILRQQGRGVAEFAVWYNKDSKVDWMHVWSIASDGKEYELKKNEFRDYAGYSYLLYEDDRARVGKAPAADPGAVVAVEYQSEEPFYLPELEWSTSGQYPIHRNRMTVQLPEGFHYSVQWKQHAAVLPTEVSHNRWQWELLDQPAIDFRSISMEPEMGELESIMTLHYDGPGVPAVVDWKGIGNWYEGIASERAASTPEITAKAQQLTAGMSDFYDKAEAIQAFVRDQTRYVGVEIGIGGYQPHAAADVFKNRYGDCKDKATLLISMLGAAGIRATWLEVDTEHHKDAAMPSINGDHMVAAIEIPDGYQDPRMHSVVTLADGRRFLITDATWSYTPFGQIEYELQGTTALLVDGSRSQAIQIPVMAPEQNRHLRTAHLKLDADGRLSGSVTENLYGDVAANFRLRFSEMDEHHRLEYLDQYVGSSISGITLTDQKVSGESRVNDELAITYNVNAPAYGKTMGALMMVRPRVLGTSVMPTDDKKREYPVNFRWTVQSQSEFDIELPDGYAVDELPHRVKLDTDFASYESRTVAVGKNLHYSKRFVIHQLELPENRYGEYLKLMSAIAQDERANTVLRKVQ